MKNIKFLTSLLRLDVIESEIESEGLDFSTLGERRRQNEFSPSEWRNGDAWWGKISISKTDPASIISLNTRNNYASLLGLKYYARGHEKHPSYSTKTCIKSLSKWITDVDALTTDNWTGLARIRLAKQHGSGGVFDLICVTVDNEVCDWEKVKKKSYQPHVEGQERLCQVFC